MGFGAVISAAQARWLACDGTISRVVFGPDGAPLDLGREHRLADRYLRRAVDLRDSGCVFTGCDAPTWWCDVHHLIHWLDGGETNLENSALLCERHHAKVHHGFRVERQRDGRWRTWRPDGTESSSAPACNPRPDPPPPSHPGHTPAQPSADSEDGSATMRAAADHDPAPSKLPYPALHTCSDRSGPRRAAAHREHACPTARRPGSGPGRPGS
jgi:hypothetical protein